MLHRWHRAIGPECVNILEDMLFSLPIAMQNFILFVFSVRINFKFQSSRYV